MITNWTSNQPFRHIKLACQSILRARAQAHRQKATVKIDHFEEFKEFFDNQSPGGLAACHFVDVPEIEEKLKPLKVTARCIPLKGDAEFDNDDGGGTCIFTGQPSQRRGLFAKAY